MPNDAPFLSVPLSQNFRTASPGSAAAIPRTHGVTGCFSHTAGRETHIERRPSGDFRSQTREVHAARQGQRAIPGRLTIPLPEHAVSVTKGPRSRCLPVRAIPPMPGLTLTDEYGAPVQISIREKKCAPSMKIATVTPPKTVKSRARPKTPRPKRKMRKASTL